MSNSLKDIVARSENFVKQYIHKNLNDHFVYHNLTHTEEVVSAAIEIGKGNNLPDEEMDLLKIAAWFHDVGYAEDQKEHEKKSAEIALPFLQDTGLAKEKIDIIINAIMATKMPQSPKTTLEKVLCDADLHSVGTKEFFQKSQLLRNEQEVVNETIDNEKDWLDKQIDFIQSHKFHTPFAKAFFKQRKEKNISKLYKKLEKEKDRIDTSADVPKSKKPSRGIETLFRQTLRNHTHLSAIADNKANIMLSINAIILSIVISTLVPRFNSDSELIIPTCILLLVCVLTIIFATLSTSPKITEGKVSRQDVLNKRANLVFFGNFYKMQLEEFEWAMGEVLQDEDFLYGSLKRDLYFLGKVLARKYKYLRITYTIFMYGIIISVLAFVIVFLTPVLF